MKKINVIWLLLHVSLKTSCIVPGFDCKMDHINIFSNIFHFRKVWIVLNPHFFHSELLSISPKPLSIIHLFIYYTYSSVWFTAVIYVCAYNTWQNWIRRSQGPLTSLRSICPSALDRQEMGKMFALKWMLCFCSLHVISSGSFWD